MKFVEHSRVRLNNRMHLIVCILFIASLSSCFTLRPPQYVKASSITSANNEEGYQLQVNLNMYNPNNWSLRLTDITAEIRIDSSMVGKTILQNEVRLKRNSDFILPIQFNATNQDLALLTSVGFKLLTGNAKVNAVFSGSMVLKKFIFRRKIQFRYSENVDAGMLRSLF